MGNESRVIFLESFLSQIGYDNSLRALDWMIEEMNADRGFKRHNGANYYTHLVDTATDLLNHGVRNQDIITATILHDSVEDVEGITVKMIEDKFNSNIAKMVDDVTKKEGINYKLEENLIKYLNVILLNAGSSLIKASDRKHNFGTLKDATQEKKLRQALETEKFFIPFFKEARKRYPRYAGYFFSAKTAIEPHLWEIKEHYQEVEKLKKQIIQLGGTIQ